MKITSVTVRIPESENLKMKGFASVVIDDCFAVHDIRIIENEDKVFVAMPSRKKANGEYRDIAHPLDADCRKMFEDAIIEAYKKEIETR